LNTSAISIAGLEPFKTIIHPENLVASGKELDQLLQNTSHFTAPVAK